MAYTLAGDRGVEYDFAQRHLPRGIGLVLDIGPGVRANMARFAIGQGYSVIAYDLVQTEYAHPKFQFRRKDFLRARPRERFDWVMNVSSIEHFGLAGRYEVETDDPDADLKGMNRIRKLMKPDAKMILTIPLGIDTVHNPYHRIYGQKRLPMLLDGYEVLVQQYWTKKNGINKFVECLQGGALTTVPVCGPPNFYALGGFVLGIKDD